MDPSENSRRLAVLTHTVLFASLGAYVVLLLFAHRQMAGAGSTPPSPRIFAILAFVGAAQFLAASWAGRTLLRSRRAGALARVRRYFLLRGAAAEAIGLYGLLAGIRQAPPAYTVAFFVMAFAAMLLCAPTRAAWAETANLAGAP